MTKTTPKPGKKLTKILTISQEIFERFEEFSGSLMSDTEDKAFGDFMKSIKEQIGPDADAYHAIMAQVDQRAEIEEDQADKHALRGVIMRIIYASLEAQVIDQIGAKEDGLKGETFTFKMKEADPQIIIEESKLDAAYLTEIKVPDEQKIKAEFSGGIEIPGVTLKKRYVLDVLVNKAVDV